MANVEDPTFTADEYLALERIAETRNEYRDGHIYQMAGASPEHEAIVLNIGAELRSHLKGKRCRAFSSNLRIGTLSGRQIAYPDLSVVCGDLRYRDDVKDVVTSPVVLIEVLSPSTGAHDRPEKFESYREIETFEEYLLVAQDRPYIEHYRRRTEGDWLLTIASGLDAVVSMPSIGCVLRLTEVYDGIRFA